MRFAARLAGLIWLGASLAFAQITVTGNVATPLKLSAADLAGMPREKVEVPEQNGSVTTYEGVLLREILKRAGTPSGSQLRGKALTTYVLAKGHDRYAVILTLAEVDEAFANEKILVADQRDGKPLPENQGPFRLICAGDQAGSRSVRMLESVEVVQLLK